jgi:hypothetical protein
MSNFLGIIKVLLTNVGVVMLAASGVCAQTTDCSGPSELGPNSTRSSALTGTAGNVQGAGGTKASPSNGSSVPTGQPGKDGAPQHTVSLSWKASTSPNVVGYNIYRQQDSNPRQQLNSAPIPGTSCIDSSVQNGHTYSYWARAVNSIGKVSVVDSNVATATIQASGSDRHDAPAGSGVVSGKGPIQ